MIARTDGRRALPAREPHAMTKIERYYALHPPGADDESREALKAVAKGIPDAQVIESDVSLMLRQEGPDAISHGQARQVGVIMPPGSAPDMWRHMSRSQREALAALVSRGAHYTGVCAGAILGAQFCMLPMDGGEFDLGTVLGLVTGLVARCPALPAYKDLYQDLTWQTAPVVEVWQPSGQKVRAKWHSGPRLDGPERGAPPGEVVARFERYRAPGSDQAYEVADRPCAVLEAQRGAGTLKLSGVHPEMEVEGETEQARAARIAFAIRLFQRDPEPRQDEAAAPAAVRPQRPSGTAEPGSTPEISTDGAAPGCLPGLRFPWRRR